MTAATIDIRANASQAVSEFDRLKARASGSLQAMQSEATALQATLGMLAGGAAAVSFVGMVKGALEAGDELNKLSQRTGMSVETLSAYQYAAGLADVSAQDFAKSVKTLNLAIAQGIAGDKEKLAVFKQLGVQLKDNHGVLRTTEAILLDVADAFQAHADGAGKAAVGEALMGKGSQAMIPLLNGGSDAIKQMRAEAESLGLVIGADFAAQAEAFNDNITKLQSGSKGLGIQIASELLPTLQALTEELLRNRDASGEAGDSFGKRLGGGMRTAIEAATVLGANVNFVLQGIGRELGAVAAQFAAIGRGDFSQWNAISEAVKADGERARKELEALERRLMGYKESAAGAGRGSVNPAMANPAGDKPQLALASAAASAASEYDKLLARINERIALGNQELAQGRELTEDEKFRVKVLQDLDEAGAKVTATQRAYIKSMLDAAGEVQQAVLVERSAYNDAKAIAEARQKQRNDEYEQARQFTLQLMEEDNARMKAAREQLEAIEFETQLLGMNTVERERAMAVREMERAGIKEGAKAWEEYADKIKNATEARAARQQAVDAAKAVADEWRQTGQDIYRGLTDSLYRGFESGKGFAQSFFDSLKALAKTTVIQVGVQMVTGGSTGWLATALGANPTMARGGIGGGGGMLGMANNAQSIYSAGSNLYSGGQVLYSMGAYNMSAANAAGTLYANAAGGGMDALLATNGAYGTAAAAGAAEGGAAMGAGAAAGGEAAGATGALASMGPWGWAALAVIALFASGAFSGGETRSGAEYTNGTKLRGPSGGEINQAGAQTALQGTIDSINSGIATLGGNVRLGTLYSGLESSGDGMGFAYAGAQLSDGTVVGQGGPTMDALEAARMNRRGSKSEQQAFAEWTEELKQTTLQALQAADIKGKLADYIKGLGNIDQLTGGALDEAYNRVAKALSERTALEKRLAEVTEASASATDRLNKQREAERAAIDETNHDLLDAIYARLDLDAAGQQLVDAAGREAAAIQQTMTATQQAADAHRAYARDLRQFAQSLAMGDLSTAGVLAKVGLAQYQFESVSSAAMAGDVNARGRLQGASSDYLNASLASASSQLDYQRTFATVQAVLEATAAGADGQATIEEQQLAVQQQQLDAMQQQLQAFGLVGQAMLSYADALANYIAKRDAVDAAQAAVSTTTSSAPAVSAPQPAATPSSWSMQDWLNGGGGWNWNEPTGFADGTPPAGFPGGLRLVGEEGPELEVTGPSRIYSASQTRDLLAGRNDNADVVAELRALQRQQDMLRTALEAIARHTVVGNGHLSDMRTRGVQIRDADSQVVPTFKVAA